MTTHILPSQSFKPARPVGFGTVISALAAATIRMPVALLNALRRPQATVRRPSHLDEANELRAYANQFLRNDPGFAADLYAAADRHELSANA